MQFNKSENPLSILINLNFIISYKLHSYIKLRKLAWERNKAYIGSCQKNKINLSENESIIC